MLKIAKAVVILMSAECLIVAVGFASSGNIKMAAYWFSACVINSIAYTF